MITFREIKRNQIKDIKIDNKIKNGNIQNLITNIKRSIKSNGLVKFNEKALSSNIIKETLISNQSKRKQIKEVADIL